MCQNFLAADAHMAPSCRNSPFWRRMIGSQAAISSGMGFVWSTLKIPRGRQIEDGMGVARSVLSMLLWPLA